MLNWQWNKIWLNCTVNYSTVLYCTVLYRTVLYYTVLSHTVTSLADTHLLIKLYAWSFRQKVLWWWWHCNYSFKLQVQVRLWERPWSWDSSRPWNLTWPGSFGPGPELDNILGNIVLWKINRKVMFLLISKSNINAMVNFQSESWVWSLSYLFCLENFPFVTSHIACLFKHLAVLLPLFLIFAARCRCWAREPMLSLTFVSCRLAVTWTGGL